MSSWTPETLRFQGALSAPRWTDCGLRDVLETAACMPHLSEETTFLPTFSSVTLHVSETPFSDVSSLWALMAEA